MVILKINENDKVITGGRLVLLPEAMWGEWLIRKRLQGEFLAAVNVLLICELVIQIATLK